MKKGTMIEGLYREVYGHYEGDYRINELEIYLTTDRYFEKYVLLTNEGIYELWAGGFRLTERTDLNDCVQEERFGDLTGWMVDTVKAVPDTSLQILFNNGATFEIGLCPAYNKYNHPERYLMLRN
ncbi:MAG: hypothetical protein EOP49_28080 [Sphingobacteriales bacterium]|nr:MAG: hypothetical protein EOP49_28080 [Sphingobacteriales bacterium]